jgi:hypothetical protein
MASGAVLSIPASETTRMSLTTIVLHVLCTAFAAVIFISFGEVAIHRHLMHRQRLWGWLYRALPDLRAQFKNHALLHHGKYYAEFDHEPDPEGKTFNVRILWGDRGRLQITFIPVLVILGLTVSWLSALTFAAMVLLHNHVWGVVHMQMHVPQPDCWFRNTRYFRFITRHHFMHHQQSNKNYNVVLPFADFVLGRAIGPRVSDVRHMLRLGLVDPRHPASVPRIARMRAADVERRAALPAADSGVDSPVADFAVAPTA